MCSNGVLCCATVQDVRAKLPGPAHSLYYKDLIGNISSSNTVHSPKQVRAHNKS